MNEHIGYNMIDRPWGTQHQVEYNNLISRNGEWGICFIKWPHNIEKKTKAKIKMPLEITHVLTIFLEHGMIADIPR